MVTLQNQPDFTSIFGVWSPFITYVVCFLFRSCSIYNIIIIVVSHPLAVFTFNIIYYFHIFCLASSPSPQTLQSLNGKFSAISDYRSQFFTRSVRVLSTRSNIIVTLQHVTHKSSPELTYALYVGFDSFFSYPLNFADEQCNDVTDVITRCFRRSVFARITCRRSQITRQAYTRKCNTAVCAGPVTFCK